MSPKKVATKSTKSTPASGKNAKGLSSEEIGAMKERLKELKAEERSRSKKADGENDLRAKIAELKEPDRSLAKKIHAIVQANAPELLAKTWYGMPAYANKDDKIVCFYQPAQKFGTRYGTFGFNDSANLDDGNLFPVAFAVTEITPAEEAKLIAIVKKAVS